MYESLSLTSLIPLDTRPAGRGKLGTPLGSHMFRPLHSLPSGQRFAGTAG